jgi:hypothetical protein
MLSKKGLKDKSFRTLNMAEAKLKELMKDMNV